MSLRGGLDQVRSMRNRLLGRADLVWYRRHGARIGTNVHLGPGARLDDSHCWLIEIGDDVTIAPYVIVLAHDASTMNHLGVTYIAPVSLRRACFIGAGSIVLPGTTVGEGAIVAAGSVVTRDVADRTLVAGNPARPIGTVDGFTSRHHGQLAILPRFPTAQWTEAGGLDEAGKLDMALRARGGGYLT